MARLMAIGVVLAEQANPTQRLNLSAERDLIETCFAKTVGSAYCLEGIINVTTS